ncbi:MAG: histidine kinase [Clostridia bacterium]|nr:histidine kinase [Clostridia bacterium]
MEFTFSRPVFLLPLISTISILIVIIVFLLKGKKTVLLSSCIILQIFTFLWTFGQTIQYISANGKFTWITLIPIHTSVNYLPLAWLIFSYLYTRKGSGYHIKKMLPLFIAPTVSYILFLTSGYHHVYFEFFRYDSKNAIYVEYGTYFWFSIIISYCYVAAGMVMLVNYSVKYSGVARKQAVILVFAPLVSFAASTTNAIYIFITNTRAPQFFDLTPTFFTITMVLFSIAAFRYQLLDITPIALEKIFENLKESILVIDSNNGITNFNHSIIKNFGAVYSGDDIKMFTDNLRSCIGRSEDTEVVLRLIESSNVIDLESGELNLTNPDFKTFNLNIQSLQDKKGRYQGRIITFNDVSEYKKLLTELNIKNTELSDINKQLEDHLKTVEELAIAKERNRVAREVHDTLGHTLTLLIMLMKACRIECDSNLEETKIKLSEGIQIAQEGLQELRHSISSLFSEDMQNQNIIEGIGGLVDASRNLGIKIDYTVFGQEYCNNISISRNSLKVSDTLYKICKEAITNSLRHGSPTQINIILRFTEDRIKLFIVDNGRGCNNIVKGYGLIGMENRAKELNGEFTCGSDGESGFNIRVELPIGG